MPPADSLQKLRHNIDRKPHRIKRVLGDAMLRKEFFDGIPNDEKKAVRAFTKQNAESALKTRSVSSHIPLHDHPWHPTQRGQDSEFFGETPITMVRNHGCGSVRRVASIPKQEMHSSPRLLLFAP